MPTDHTTNAPTTVDHLPPPEPQQHWAATRQMAHPQCRLCGPLSCVFPALNFTVINPGQVGSTVICGDDQEGYAGLVHGGISAGLIDSAMTNALFSLGAIGVTARLQLRYRRPLFLRKPLSIQAKAAVGRLSGWSLEAHIEQEGLTCISAEGYFMPHPEFSHD